MQEAVYTASLNNRRLEVAYRGASLREEFADQARQLGNIYT